MTKTPLPKSTPVHRHLAQVTYHAFTLVASCSYGVWKRDAELFRVHAAFGSMQLFRQSFGGCIFRFFWALNPTKPQLHGRFGCIYKCDHFNRTPNISSGAYVSRHPPKTPSPQMIDSGLHYKLLVWGVLVWYVFGVCLKKHLWFHGKWLSPEDSPMVWRNGNLNVWLCWN